MTKFISDLKSIEYNLLLNLIAISDFKKKIQIARRLPNWKCTQNVFLPIKNLQ